MLVNFRTGKCLIRIWHEKACYSYKGLNFRKYTRLGSTLQFCEHYGLNIESPYMGSTVEQRRVMKQKRTPL